MARKKLVPDEAKSKCIDEKLKIKSGSKSVDAIISVPKKDPKPVGVVLAHGASGDMTMHQVEHAAHYLAAHGITVLRFTHNGRTVDLRAKAFTDCLKAFEKHKSAKDIKHFFLSGRSMGARVAVTVANSLCEDSSIGKKIKGCICFAYPLHTNSDTKNLRDAILIDLKVPVLFISGDKDPMMKLDIFNKVKKKLKVDQTLQILENGNHSLGGKSEAKLRQVGQWAVDWIIEQVDGKKKDVETIKENEDDIEEEKETKKRKGTEIRSRAKTSRKRRKLK